MRFTNECKMTFRERKPDFSKGKRNCEEIENHLGFRPLPMQVGFVMTLKTDRRDSIKGPWHHFLEL